MVEAEQENLTDLGHTAVVERDHLHHRDMEAVAAGLGMLGIALAVAEIAGPGMAVAVDQAVRHKQQHHLQHWPRPFY